MSATLHVRSKPSVKHRRKTQIQTGVYLEQHRRPPRLPAFFEDLDVSYRALCAILFNFSTSGHPGGSISAGKAMEGLLFEHMDYEFGRPELDTADHICFAAGHKALGLYAMWAIRNELVRIARPKLLARPARQLRFEDLLGFRRNPTQNTPLFKKFKCKALDGHPTPIVPFVPFAAGPSGVALTASAGYALGARDAYGENAPRVHVIEGEGGMTPGRVHEILAAAATNGLENLILHLDWNQASIDSNRVCPERGEPGDYVQWDPAELLHLHGWNVIFVSDGHDGARVLDAQREALALCNGRPTALVYRTVKGWRYGIEGKASHGGGHEFASEGYYRALSAFELRFAVQLPRFPSDLDEIGKERAYFATLEVMRRAFKERPGFAKAGADRVAAAGRRLKAKRRRLRPDAPRIERLYSKSLSPAKTPPALKVKLGAKETLRGALGSALGYLNTKTGGGLLIAAADLYGSTSVAKGGAGFGEGFYHPRRNPKARLVSAGGIAEDAMGGMMSGVSAFTRHVGVTSSYAAFIVAMEHVPARVHAIGQYFRRETLGEPYHPWIMVCAHAGPMTGEDGPTHADPQPLQLLQGNFPAGTLITLTPWEPQEVWPLLIAGLKARPAVLAPFVTRPATVVPDRRALGFPPASAAAQGVYALRRARTKATVVLQGSASATFFVSDVLPALEKEGRRLNVFYVASAELFDLLPEGRRRKIFPEELTRHAMGITDFTLPTLHRWVRTDKGLRASLHPFRGGGFLGSGAWTKVLEEGGLDGASQLRAVRSWLREVS